jgi:hypothetical protein
MRHVHQEQTGFDGIAETRPGVLQNGGNGLLFECLHSKRGPLDREGCGVPQNGGNGLVLERLWSKQDPVHREGCGIPQNGTPRATVHPPSTSSSLHLGLFIHHDLPHASTRYCSSMGILFIQPPPATVQPALHGVLLIHPQPARVWRPPRSGSCSSSGNDLLPRGPVHATPTGNYSSNPQQRSLFIKRQVRSASVSTSSEGIARVQLTAKGSITRVQ